MSGRQAEKANGANNAIHRDSAGLRDRLHSQSSAPSPCSLSHAVRHPWRMPDLPCSRIYFNTASRAAIGQEQHPQQALAEHDVAPAPVEKSNRLEALPGEQQRQHDRNDEHQIIQQQINRCPFPPNSRFARAGPVWARTSAPCRRFPAQSPSRPCRVRPGRDAGFAGPRRRIA